MQVLLIYFTTEPTNNKPTQICLIFIKFKKIYISLVKKNNNNDFFKPTGNNGKLTWDNEKSTSDNGKPTFYNKKLNKNNIGQWKPTMDRPTLDVGTPTLDNGKPT